MPVIPANSSGLTLVEPLILPLASKHSKPMKETESTERNIRQ